MYGGQQAQRGGYGGQHPGQTAQGLSIGHGDADLFAGQTQAQAEERPPVPPVPEKDFTKAQPAQCNDKLWIILFFGNLAFFAYMCYEYFPVYSTQPTSPPNSDDYISWTLIGGACGVAAVVGGILGILWLVFMQKHARGIIKCGIVMNVAWTLALGGYMIFLGSLFWGILMLLIGVLMFFWYKAIRHRIPMAEAFLQAAVQSEQDNKTVICTTGLMMLISVANTVLWIWSFNGYLIAHDLSNMSGKGGMLFLLLFSYYWNMEVIRNVAHVTAAGTTATWWLAPDVKNNVCGSFKRALTTSFGSICLGSLIVAFLKAVRAMVYQARVQAYENRNGFAICILCIADCLLVTLERLIAYFNKWAYVYVAIYGKSFVESSKDCWTLFKSRGWDMIINDDLSSMAWTLGIFICGIIAGGVSTLGAVVAPDECTASECAWILFALGLMVGAFVAGVVLSIVDSAVSTTFVLWAEDPASLKAHRPVFFENIRKEAEILYPDLRSFWNY